MLKASISIIGIVAVIAIIAILYSPNTVIPQEDLSGQSVKALGMDTKAARTAPSEVFKPTDFSSLLDSLPKIKISTSKDCTTTTVRALCEEIVQKH